jgi:hypothetical protein
MDKPRKRTHPSIGVLAALYVIYFLYGIGNSMMDRYEVANLTEQMKTACIGRFQVDLPKSMDFSYSRIYMNGFWISTKEETREEFEGRVLARQKEIEVGTNKLGKDNLEAAEDYHQHGFTGKIFRFGREITKGEADEKAVDWVNVQLEAHVHLNGVSFTFASPDGYDVDKTGNLTTLLDKLRLVPADELPAAPGFCFGLGMFLDPLPADYTEGVAMFAGFRDHPDLAMVLDTRAGTEPDKEGRLARNDRADVGMPLWQKPLLTKIRKGKRAIHGVEGEEVLEGGRELNFVNVYLFDWEVNGTRYNVFVPYIHLEMSTGHPVNAGARPVMSFLGEEALVQLWDRISSSIRVRSTTAPSSVKREPPARGKPGDTASAGDICPGTGWWECQHAGNGAGVAGGRRQFLTMGQRMPQALLLRPQTLWDKLRGLQSTYSLDQPTGWTLVDRRWQTRIV